MRKIRFSAAISREDIVEGAADLGIDLDKHIGIVLEAMKQKANILEL